MTNASRSEQTSAKNLLRIEEAADLLSLGRSKVYELIRDGRLPVVHIGRSARVPVRALDDFVEALIAEAAEDAADLQ